MNASGAELLTVQPFSQLLAGLCLRAVAAVHAIRGGCARQQAPCCNSTADCAPQLALLWPLSLSFMGTMLVAAVLSDAGVMVVHLFSQNVLLLPLLPPAPVDVLQLL
jgi:hypothetical protein